MKSRSGEGFYNKIDRMRQERNSQGQESASNPERLRNEALLRKPEQQAVQIQREITKLKQNSDQLDKSLKSKKHRVRNEIWGKQEVHKIFHLYNQYGSQWKLISEEFDDRTSNSVKNRFYTTIRVLLKNLFRQHPCFPSKLPHQISSRAILKFYEGQSEFLKVKGLGKRLMKKVQYEPESSNLPTVAQEHKQDLIRLYQIIFSSNSVKESSNTPVKSEDMGQQSSINPVKNEPSVSLQLKSEYPERSQLKQEHNEIRDNEQKTLPTLPQLFSFGSENNFVGFYCFQDKNNIMYYPCHPMMQYYQ